VVGSRGQVAAVVVSGEDDFGGAVVAEFALLIVQVKASEVACIRLHFVSGASFGCSSSEPVVSVILAACSK